MRGHVHFKVHIMGQTVTLRGLDAVTPPSAYRILITALGATLSEIRGCTSGSCSALSAALLAGLAVQRARQVLTVHVSGTPMRGRSGFEARRGFTLLALPKLTL